jgi:outer membrane protein
MTNISKLAKTLAVATLCMALSPSWAQKSGDLILSIGGAYMKPNASLGHLTSVSTDNTGTHNIPAQVPNTQDYFNAATQGATASIKGTTTETLGVFYMWTDQIATEVTIGIPPKMSVDVGLSSGTLSGASTAKVIDPSLVAKYLFNNTGDQIRPYLGLGFTNASFTSVQANTSNSTVNSLAGTSVSLSSSWAPVFNAGFFYNLDEKWSVNTSLSYVPLKTTVTFVGPGYTVAPVTTTGVLTINPWDLVIRVGYKF